MNISNSKVILRTAILALCLLFSPLADAHGGGGWHGGGGGWHGGGWHGGGGGWHGNGWHGNGWHGGWNNAYWYGGAGAVIIGAPYWGNYYYNNCQLVRICDQFGNCWERNYCN